MNTRDSMLVILVRMQADALRACHEILKRRDVGNPFFHYWSGRRTMAEDIIRHMKDQHDADVREDV